MPSMQPLYISATVVAVVMPIMAPLDPVSIYGVAAPVKWGSTKRPVGSAAWRSR